MRLLLPALLLLPGCGLFPCGTHDLGDDRTREACGPVGSWGDRSTNSGRATWIALEPWGRYTRDDEGAVERPGFLIALDDAWLVPDTEVPADQLLAACMDMGVLQPTDDVALTVVRASDRQILGATSFVLEWSVACEGWDFASEGRDVVEFGPGSDDWASVEERLGLPPERAE